jgi:hypothetical protein
MIQALRYIEQKEVGFWEVQSAETIQAYPSLRYFQREQEVLHAASQALQHPGQWVRLRDAIAYRGDAPAG